MGYLHIDNLYKNQEVLLLKEVYCLEKVHGTSAHVRFLRGNPEPLRFYNGGETREKFLACFDQPALLAAFEAQGFDDVTVFGEAYGGKQQGMAKRYGKETRFVAFDVRVGEEGWLSVPAASAFVEALGLRFVQWAQEPATLERLDFWRDAPSTEAQRNGVEGDQPREGIVIRPLIELRNRWGARVMAKHKRPEERETKTRREVGTPPLVLESAVAVANEWVTPMRLEHVLQKLPQGLGLEGCSQVVSAMVEDVLREGAGEVEDTKANRKQIGHRAVTLFKQRVQEQFRKGACP